MVTSQQIQQTRQQFVAQQRRIEQARSQIPRVTEAQLRQEKGLEAREQRREISKAKSKIKGVAKQLAKERGKFEGQAKRFQEFEKLKKRVGNIQQAIKLQRKDINREEKKLIKAAESGNQNLVSKLVNKIEKLQRSLRTTIKFAAKEKGITLITPTKKIKEKLGKLEKLEKVKVKIDPSGLILEKALEKGFAKELPLELKQAVTKFRQIQKDIDLSKIDIEGIKIQEPVIAKTITKVPEVDIPNIFKPTREQLLRSSDVRIAPPRPKTIEFDIKTGFKIDLDEIQRRISQESSKVETFKSRGDLGRTAQGIGLGLASSAVFGARFISDIVTKPIKTLEDTISNIPKLPKAIAEATKIAKQRPAFATGFVTGEILQVKGFNSLVRAVPNIIKASSKVTKQGLKPLTSEQIAKAIIEEARGTKGAGKVFIERELFKEVYPSKLELSKAQKLAIESAKKSTKESKVLIDRLKLARRSDFEKLSKFDQNFILSKIKTEIRTNPERFLPSARRKMLENLRKQKEKLASKERLENFKLGRIREISEFDPKQTAKFIEEVKRKPKLEKRLDTEVELIERDLKAAIKESKLKEQKINEGVKRLETLRRSDFEKLSKFDKKIVLSKIKTEIRTNPELFVPKASKLALKKIRDISEKKRLIKEVRIGKIRNVKIQKFILERELQNTAFKQALKPTKLPDATKKLLSNLEKKRLRDTTKQFLKDSKIQTKEIKSVNTKLKNLPKATQEIIKNRLEISLKQIGKKKGDFLTKGDKEFIKKQFEKRVLKEPELFIDSRLRKVLEKAKSKSKQVEIAEEAIKRLKLARETKPIKLPKVKIILEKRPKKIITAKDIFKEPKIPKNTVVKEVNGQIVLQKVKTLTKKQKPKTVTQITGTKAGTIIKSKQIAITAQKTKQLFKQARKSKFKQILLAKEITNLKTQQKQLSKTKTKQKLVQKQKLKQKEKSLSKQFRLQTFKTRTLSKEATKQKLKQKIFEKLIKIPKPKIVPKQIPESTTKLKKLKLEKGQVRGFIPEVKRRGKFQAVSKKPLPRGKAIKRGAGVTRQTLAAQFRVRATNQAVKGKSGIKAPSQKEFRDFKIQKGKRVKLNNQWIEKRNRRLSSRSEVSEIMRFK